MKMFVRLLLLVVVAATPTLAAESLYRQHCAACHGLDLSGGRAQSLLNGIWRYGAARHEIVMNIRDGLPHLGMPGFGGTLNRQQIGTLADYLLAQAREAGAGRPSLPEVTYSLEYTLTVTPWVEGLDVPWSLAFLDARTALITERPGRLRLVRDGVLQADPIRGTPAVVAESQGGLLAVAADPEFATSGWVYLAYSHAMPGSDARPVPAMTRVVRGRLRDGAWVDQQTVFEAPHDTYTPTRHHYGTRIVFDRDGLLYFSIGDRGLQGQAQDLALPSGKVHRVHRDGSIPADNPFVGQDGALPSIFALGVRNSQGLAFHPTTGELWASDHGPLGGDEINLIRAGLNYGWPLITYGRNYDGSSITDHTALPGFEQPVMYYTPSIAICALAFYDGDLFTRWQGRLLVTALRYEEVRVLDVHDGRVLHDQVVLKSAGRVRDVVVGPDGAIYAVLNSPGVVLRLAPQGPRS